MSEESFLDLLRLKSQAAAEMMLIDLNAALEQRPEFVYVVLIEYLVSKLLDYSESAEDHEEIFKSYQAIIYLTHLKFTSRYLSCENDKWESIRCYIEEKGL